MEGADRWLAHSQMSDPGRHAGAIATLPAGIETLHQIIQGVLVHADWAREYGLDETTLDPTARKTLPIAERLDDVLKRDPRPLGVQRPADKRSTGTCRDFALALCSFLRCSGVPARVRCGFAAYFGGAWEDHWVCEYWDSETGTWRLSDAQIDHMLRQRNRIEFDSTDVPPGGGRPRCIRPRQRCRLVVPEDQRAARSLCAERSRDLELGSLARGASTQTIDSRRRDGVAG